MEPEILVLVFKPIPFDKLSHSGEHVDDLNFGRDACVQFLRQLRDNVARGHRRLSFSLVGALDSRLSHPESENLRRSFPRPAKNTTLGRGRT